MLVHQYHSPAINAGDIINFALDMDNGAWYIGVNGTSCNWS